MQRQRRRGRGHHAVVLEHVALGHRRSSDDALWLTSAAIATRLKPGNRALTCAFRVGRTGLEPVTPCASCTSGRPCTSALNQNEHVTRGRASIAVRPHPRRVAPNGSPNGSPHPLWQTNFPGPRVGADRSVNEIRSCPADNLSAQFRQFALATLTVDHVASPVSSRRRSVSAGLHSCRSLAGPGASDRSDRSMRLHDRMVQRLPRVTVARSMRRRCSQGTASLAG